MSEIERQLEEIARLIRIDVVTMIHKAGDGHPGPALYAAPARKGYFPQSELIHLRSLESFLQGHPDMNNIPGIDSTSGSILANYWRKHK
jgi:transketolase N-terminal domain/subunit